MKEDRRNELIDKIKGLDTNKFTINLTDDNTLHIYLGNSFTDTLLNPKNDYVDRIINLSKDFDVKDYVNNKIDDIYVNDTSEIFEAMGVYNLLEIVDDETLGIFENDLKEYLAIKDDEFNEFYDSLFDPVKHDIVIDEIETYPQYLDDIIISNIPEINEVLENIDEAIQEHEASSKTNNIML